jgi:hypothetical protein
MATETEIVAAVPFSGFRGDAHEFLTRVSYTCPGEAVRARDMRRAEGDCLLLTRVLSAVGPDGCAAELGEETLRDIVEEVEDRLPGWRLSGDDSQSVLERLDAHFAGRQRAWLEQRRERDALLAARARAEQEHALDELRAGIATARQALKDTEARIEAMEDQLAAEAERLGVPVWP